jgi:hypothetical protein
MPRSVQPVVHKETVQPEVVHTTVPIHETHHASTQHHGTSVLPMKNLSEFGTSGHQGSRHEEYEGVPRSYNKDMQQEQTDADINPLQKGVDGPGSHHTGGTTLSGNEPFTDDGHMIKGQGGSAGGYGTHGTPSTGYSGQDANGSSGLRSGEQGYGNSNSNVSSNIANGKFGDFEGRDNTQGLGTNHNDASNTTTGKKASLMDKLNPKVDSNGDGKAGFMK